MKFALTLVILIGSTALAGGPFDGFWSGSGNLLSPRGQQGCKFEIQINQPATDVSLDYINMMCTSGSNEAFYYYKSSGNKIYDIGGNEVGEVSSDMIHISTQLAGTYVHEVDLKLESNKIWFYETWITQCPNCGSSYSTFGSLAKPVNP